MRPDPSQDVNAAIARKIAAGTLPRDDAARVRAREGTGSPCTACDGPIRKEQVEYENTMADGRTFRFHPHCLNVWHSVRTRA